MKKNVQFMLGLILVILISNRLDGQISARNYPFKDETLKELKAKQHLLQQSNKSVVQNTIMTQKSGKVSGTKGAPAWSWVKTIGGTRRLNLIIWQ